MFSLDKRKKGKMYKISLLDKRYCVIVCRNNSKEYIHIHKVCYVFFEVKTIHESCFHFMYQMHCQNQKCINYNLDYRL